MAFSSFSKSSDFRNFNASSEIFRTLAAGKDKSVEFIRKSLNLAPYPLLYRWPTPLDREYDNEEEHMVISSL